MNDNIQPEVLRTLRSDALHKVNQGKRRTHAFNVDFTEYNPEFHGKFIVHYPTQLERLRIGVTKSELLGGHTVDVTTDNIAHITATLDTILDMKPDWFDMDNEELDYNMLEAIYMEYLNWANSFRTFVGTSTNKGDSTDRRSEVPVVDTKDVSDTANGQ